jgi:predicted phage tail protein
MLTRVLLYGHLRKRFGREFQFAIETPGEAIRALCSQIPDFKDYMLEHSEPGYRMLLDGEASGEDRLKEPLFGVATIKLVPVVAGAKNEWGWILTGVAIIGVVGLTGGLAGLGMFGSLAGTSWLSNMAVGMGMSMVLGGVSQVLTGNPSANTESPSDKPGGKYFNGPACGMGQGGCIPVRYGKIRVGGLVLSASSNYETYATGANGGAFSGGDGKGIVATGDGVTTPFVWSIDPAV